MDVRVFATPGETARALAQRIAGAVAARPDLVLGLSTGRSPVDAYAELRRMYEREELDFSRVRTFNLDEFAGIAPDHPGSYRQFMRDHLFDGLRVSPSQIHFLNGAAADLDAECRRYEEEIEAVGGIDLQLLGIGANGHIGFNEPGDELTALTHRVGLHEVTRRDNAALFGGEIGRVPREGLSMGMASILGARAIVLIATGERKATGVRQMVHGPLTTRLPASFLQLHRQAELFLDREAAALL